MRTGLTVASRVAGIAVTAVAVGVTPGVAHTQCLAVRAEELKRAASGGRVDDVVVVTAT